jgi:hypothetical protein
VLTTPASRAGAVLTPTRRNRTRIVTMGKQCRGAVRMTIVEVTLSASALSVEALSDIGFI